MTISLSSIALPFNKRGLTENSTHAIDFLFSIWPLEAEMTAQILLISDPTTGTAYTIPIRIPGGTRP